jgi:hypothetical protein
VVAREVARVLQRGLPGDGLLAGGADGSRAGGPCRPEVEEGDGRGRPEAAGRRQEGDGGQFRRRCRRCRLQPGLPARGAAEVACKAEQGTGDVRAGGDGAGGRLREPARCLARRGRALARGWEDAAAQGSPEGGGAGSQKGGGAGIVVGEWLRHTHARAHEGLS